MFIELFVVFGILGDFSEKFQTFLDDVLSDDLKDLVVLKILSGDV